MTKLPSGAHPSHLQPGPLRSLYEYLYRERQSCDTGTVMWKRLTEHMDTILSCLRPEAAMTVEAKRYLWITRSILNNYSDVYDILNSAYKMTQAELDAAIDRAMEEAGIPATPMSLRAFGSSEALRSYCTAKEIAGEKTAWQVAYELLYGAPSPQHSSEPKEQP